MPRKKKTKVEEEKKTESNTTYHKVKTVDTTKRPKLRMENVLADLLARRRVKHNTKKLNSK